MSISLWIHRSIPIMFNDVILSHFINSFIMVVASLFILHLIITVMYQVSFVLNISFLGNYLKHESSINTSVIPIIHMKLNQTTSDSPYRFSTYSLFSLFFARTVTLLMTFKEINVWDIRVAYYSISRQIFPCVVVCEWMPLHHFMA